MFFTTTSFRCPILKGVLGAVTHHKNCNLLTYKAQIKRAKIIRHKFKYVGRGWTAEISYTPIKDDDDDPSTH